MLLYKKFRATEDLSRAHMTDAGIDLRNAGAPLDIPPGGRAVIPTGVGFKIPSHHFGLVLMRSGHGFKRNLMAHPGVIDAGYRGEVMVKVFNLGDEPQVIETEERFAQLLIIPYASDNPIEVTVLDESDRNEGGFGSSGVS